MALQGQKLAAIDPQSLLEGLSGERVSLNQALRDPDSVAEAGDESSSALDNTHSLLRRLIEEGFGAFDLADVASDGLISDVAALQQALDGLAHRVVVPYAIVGMVLLVLGFFVRVSPLPEITMQYFSLGRARYSSPQGSKHSLTIVNDEL